MLALKMPLTQSQLLCGLQPQHLIQQFDWFDGLLPQAIWLERMTALLRCAVCLHLADNFEPVAHGWQCALHFCCTACCD